LGSHHCNRGLRRGHRSLGGSDMGAAANGQRNFRAATGNSESSLDAGAGLTAQLGQLSHAVTQQLGQVSQQVQSGMASTGTLVSDAQRAVSVQLQSATSIMGTLQQQLGKVEQSGRDLSDAAKAIESVLGGAKTRGLLGEVVLERMLADTLPANAYECNTAFQMEKPSTQPCTSTENSFPSTRNFRWMIFAAWKWKAKRRARDLPQLCAFIPTPSPRNISCREKTRSISR